MWATLALERSASSRRSAEALDEMAGWSAAGRSRRVGGGRAVPPPPPRPAQQPSARARRGLLVTVIVDTSTRGSLGVSRPPLGPWFLGAADNSPRE